MKHVLRIFLFLNLLFVTTTGFSQTLDLSSKNKKAVKNYKAAESAFKSSEYTVSLDYLEKAISKDGDFIEAWLLLGDVYTELKREKAAINAFKNAIQIDSEFFPRAYFFIGNLAYKVGEYADSKTYYQLYLQFKDEQEIRRFLAKKRLKRAEIADSLESHPLDITVINTGKSINTPSDEYINFVDESFTKLILTRKIEAGMGMQGSKLFAESFFESLSDSTGWTIPVSLDFDWKEGLNIGGMNISVDGRKMYFTGCNWPTGFGSCDLFVSHRLGMTWEPPVNLGSSVNSKWWDSQPITSSDGQRIFFSSKRSGGKGGSDIWMSIKLDSGEWSPPVNLGDSINTGGNEMAPFLHSDGKTLYFSSDGHHGLGGADLFISRQDEVGRWFKARNIGYPVNTKYNEINLFMSLDGQLAFLSSDREAGEGGFDIYQINTVSAIRPQQVYFVKGIIKDKKTGKLLKAQVTLTDLNKSLVADQTVSDAKTGAFLMVLRRNIEYAFNITKPNYLFYSEHLNFKLPQNELSIEKLFEIEPLSPGNRIILENVFFDFNKSDLKPKSFIELNKLSELLIENPQIRIEIGGHTDNIGTEEYNLKLSEDRAKVVYHYLTEKGILPDRLRFKGFGTKAPISHNTNEEGRAKNRRTQIIVL